MLNQSNELDGEQIKETLEHIIHLVGPHYNRLRQGSSADLCLENLPQFLVYFLEEWEALQRNYQRQSVIIGEYEARVSDIFRAYGEQNPLTVRGLAEKLGVTEGETNPHYSCLVEPVSEVQKKKTEEQEEDDKTYQQPVISVWFEGKLKELQKAIEKGCMAIVDHHQGKTQPSFPSPTEKQRSSYDNVRNEEMMMENEESLITEWTNQMKKISCLSKSALSYSNNNNNNHNAEQSREQIEHTLQLAATSIQYLTSLVGERRVEETKKDFLEDKCCENQVTAVGLRLEELLKMMEEWGDSQHYFLPSQDNSRGVEAKEVDGIPGVSRSLPELFDQFEKTYKKKWKEMNSIALNFQALQDDHEKALEELSHIVAALPSSPTIKKQHVDEVAESSKSRNTLSVQIHMIFQHWKKMVDKLMKKEEVLVDKLRELEKVRNVLEAHAKLMREEEENTSKKGSGGTEEEKNQEDGEKRRTEQVGCLPEGFTPSQLEKYLRWCSQRLASLQREKALAECEWHTSKNNAQQLFRQVSTKKKYEEECSSVLENIALLVGLEDDFQLIIQRRGEEKDDTQGGGTKTNHTVGKETKRFLSGGNMVEALRCLYQRLQERCSSSFLLPTTVTSSPPHSPLPSGLPPLPPSSISEGKGGSRSHSGERRRSKTGSSSALGKVSSPTGGEQQRVFHEAMKMVLERLLESGIRLKKTLFVLGTDETAEDALLEELSQWFARMEGRGEEENDEEEGGEEEELLETRLAALLQKYGRWSLRLEETIQQHLVAQRRFTKYFTSVLHFFDTPPSAAPITESTSSSSTSISHHHQKNIQLQQLHRVVVGIGVQPLDNLIDIDCILIDGMEILLPVMEDGEFNQRAKQRVEEIIHSNNDDIRAEEGKTKLPKKETAEDDGRSAELETTNKSGDEDASKENVSSVPISLVEEFKGKERRKMDDEGDSTRKLYDEQLGMIYKGVRDIFRVLSDLKLVRYFAIPEDGSACSQQRTPGGGGSEKEMQFVNLPLEDLIVGTPITSSCPDEGEHAADTRREEERDKASALSAAARETNDETLRRVVLHNLQRLRQDMMLLSDEYKAAAILIRRDTDALERELAIMLAAWSAVDVEEAFFGQDRENLQLLHQVLSEQGTREKGCYALARRPERAKLDELEAHIARFKPPCTNPSSIWQFTLELLRDGLQKMIQLLSQEVRGGNPRSRGRREEEMVDDVLTELTDLAAMYVNWVERHEQQQQQQIVDNVSRTLSSPGLLPSTERSKRLFLNPLPAVVRAECVREGSDGAQQEPQHREGGCHGKEVSSEEREEIAAPTQRTATTSSSSSTTTTTPVVGRRVSHFTSPDVLPRVFMHMFELAQKVTSESVSEVRESRRCEEEEEETNAAGVLPLAEPPRGKTVTMVHTGSVYVPLPPGVIPVSLTELGGGGGAATPPHSSLSSSGAERKRVIPVDISIRSPSYGVKAASDSNNNKHYQLPTGLTNTTTSHHNNTPTTRSTCAMTEDVEEVEVEEVVSARNHTREETSAPWMSGIEALQRERDLAQSEAAVLRSQCRRLKQQEEEKKKKAVMNAPPSSSRASSGSFSQRKQGDKNPPPPSAAATHNNKKAKAPAEKTFLKPKGQGGERAPPSPSSPPSSAQEGKQESGRKDGEEEEDGKGEEMMKKKDNNSPYSSGINEPILREVLRYLQKALHPGELEELEEVGVKKKDSRAGQARGEKEPIRTTNPPPPRSVKKKEEGGGREGEEEEGGGGRRRVGKASSSSARSAGHSQNRIPLRTTPLSAPKKSHQHPASTSSLRGASPPPPHMPTSVSRGMGEHAASTYQKMREGDFTTTATTTARDYEEEVRQRLSQVYGLPLGGGGAAASLRDDRRMGGETEQERWRRAAGEGFAGVQQVMMKKTRKKVTTSATRRRGSRRTGDAGACRVDPAGRVGGGGLYDDDYGGAILEDVDAAQHVVDAQDDAEEDEMMGKDYLFGTRSSRLRYAQNHVVPEVFLEKPSSRSRSRSRASSSSSKRRFKGSPPPLPLSSQRSTHPVAGVGEWIDCSAAVRRTARREELEREVEALEYVASGRRGGGGESRRRQTSFPRLDSSQKRTMEEKEEGVAGRVRGDSVGRRGSAGMGSRSGSKPAQQRMVWVGAPGSGYANRLSSGRHQSARTHSTSFWSQEKESRDERERGMTMKNKNKKTITTTTQDHHHHHQRTASPASSTSTYAGEAWTTITPQEKKGVLRTFAQKDTLQRGESAMAADRRSPRTSASSPQLHHRQQQHEEERSEKLKKKKNFPPSVALPHATAARKSPAAATSANHTRKPEEKKMKQKKKSERRDEGEEGEGEAVVRALYAGGAAADWGLRRKKSSGGTGGAAGSSFFFTAAGNGRMEEEF